MNKTDRRLLNRRQFNMRCAAFGLTLPALGAIAVSETAKRTVRLPDGTKVPAVGQGAWHLGQARHPPAVEEEALNAGVALGMSLIDTSGNYGEGRSEQFLAHVIAGHRDQIFLVSKVESDEVAEDGIAKACDASLGRLGTDHLDLYLLHAPVPSSQFAHVVAEFEKLRTVRKILRWGVSNFDTGQMEDLYRVPGGRGCATNQVAYSLNNRRIEPGVLAWCTKNKMPVMAYSPLGGDNNLVVNNPTLTQIGTAHGCSAAAVALAWVIRSGTVIAIPESGSPAHAKENAAALSVRLTHQELQTLEAAFPAPTGTS